MFGALGYKNGKRFFTPPEGEEVDKGNQLPPPEYLELELRKQELADKRQLAEMKLQQDRELKLADIAARENLTMSQLIAKLQFEREKDQRRSQVELQKDKTRRDTVALTERNRTNEMNIKREYGSGI